VIEAVKTVMAAFLGIRRRENHDRETVAIRPVHVVVTGVALAALFVLTLITIVRFVVG
jgi:preprotein translocase subunit Sec61beta